MKSKRKVKCLQCQKEFIYGESESRPFCSDRCKEVDMGHWLFESYKLPSEEPLSEGDIEQILKQDGDQGDGWT